MTGVSWVERNVDRSPAVRRSRMRTVEHAKTMVDAALRLIAVKGDTFTTQELVKEAGVALQTFYRYFAGKDELMLAVIGDSLTGITDHWRQAARDLPDPVTRLRFYIDSIFDAAAVDDGADVSSARFMVSAHWRLHRIFPVELAVAERPFVDLLRTEIDAATAAGLLHPSDPETDTWFVVELIRTVFHHYQYAPDRSDVTKERLWHFCLTALGGSA